MAISFPDIDPVALSLGPFAIRWYSLAYVAGILLGWWYIAWLNKRTNPPPLTKAAFDDLLMPAIFGIILGGRLGYVLFYNAGYYLEHPLEALMIWRGGMSFHGGLLGVLVAYAWYAWRWRLPYLKVMDLLACAAPLGLCFGRLANFINAELWGRPTHVPWGIVFPGAGPEPRHPSQLYEAGLEGVALFLVLFLFVRFGRALERTGFISGMFLIGYSVSRMYIEQFREPDAQLGFLFGSLTMGQLLSVPMMLLGLWLVWRARRLRPA